MKLNKNHLKAVRVVLCIVTSLLMAFCNESRILAWSERLSCARNFIDGTPEFKNECRMNEGMCHQIIHGNHIDIPYIKKLEGPCFFVLNEREVRVAPPERNIDFVFCLGVLPKLPADYERKQEFEEEAWEIAMASYPIDMKNTGLTDVLFYLYKAAPSVGINLLNYIHPIVFLSLLILLVVSICQRLRKSKRV